MKTWTLIFFISLFAIYDASAQTVNSVVEGVPVNVGRERPAGKPALAYSNITYRDENNNQVLEAWEKASITFSITNRGKGVSQNLFVSAHTGNDTEIKGVVYPLVVKLDSMPPGKQRDVTVPLEGSLDLVSGLATVTVEIREEYEYDPDEIELNVVTEEFKAPKIQIAAYRLEAGQQTDAANVPVKLRLVLKNSGQGPAADVRLDFYPPDYAKPIDRPAYVVNNMAPNSSSTIEFRFSVSADKLQEEIPVRTLIIERHQKYGLDTVLKLRTAYDAGNKK
jgi:hypothetical protein